MKLDRLTLVIYLLLLMASTLILFGEVVVLSWVVIDFNHQTLLWILFSDAVARGLIAYLQGRLPSLYSHPDRLLYSTVLGAIAILGLVYGVGYSILTLAMLFWVQRILTETLYDYLSPYLVPIFTSGHRRDVFTRLIVGGRLGAALVVVGLVPLVPTLSKRDLIGLWILMAVGYLIMQSLTATFERSPDAVQEPIITQSTLADIRRLLQSGLTRWLTLSTAGITLLTTVVLYYTLDILANQNPTSFPTLFVFFTVSSAGAVWAMVPFEYWVFERLLRRVDAGRLALVYPSALNLAFVGVILVPFLPLAALGHITRTTLRHSLHLPLERLLYHTLPAGEQSWLRHMLHSVVEPSARVAGVLLLWVGFEQPYGMLGLGALIGVGLLAVAGQTGYLYGQALANSLRAGQYRVLRQTAGEWEVNEHTMIPRLLTQLQERQVEASELLLIAEVVARSEDEAAYQTLCEIWRESSASLQAELLPIIIHGWPDKCSKSEHRHLVFNALGSAYADLRIRALELIAVYPALDPEYQSARFLIDPNSKVNVVAATILLRHPIGDIQKAARAQLRWLAMDRHVSTRFAAVTALVQGSLNRFGEVTTPIDVEQYLRDPATRVREAILPAASIPQLIEAVCDPAELVRVSAAQHLRQRRWQGTLPQLFKALEATYPTPEIQIEGMMRYWRLLMAVSTVHKRIGWQRLVPALQKGFEHLLVLRTMSYSLNQLHRPALAPLIRQLDYDHTALFDAMCDTLGLLVGKARIQAITWTLQTPTASREEQEQALSALQNLTTAQLAENFRQILQGDTAPHLQSTLPHVVLSILLNQADEWHPLVTLHCISRLPNIQRILWLSEPTTEVILGRCAKSHLDVIREAARLIKRTLHDEESSEGIPMLSTLERMLLLRNVSFFQNLRLDQLRSLARGCTELSAQAGEVIIQQGAVGDGLYIVIEGRVQIQRHIDGGDKVVSLGMYGPAEAFGEISLLDGEPRTADVIAETAVFLLSIHRDALQLALEDDPNIAMTMLRIMAQRLRRTTEQIDQHSTA